MADECVWVRASPLTLLGVTLLDEFPGPTLFCSLPPAMDDRPHKAHRPAKTDKKGKGKEKQHGFNEKVRVFLKKTKRFIPNSLYSSFRLSHRNQVAEQTAKDVATSSGTKHASMFPSSTEHPTTTLHPSSSPLSGHLGSAKLPSSKVSFGDTQNNR